MKVYIILNENENIFEITDRPLEKDSAGDWIFNQRCIWKYARINRGKNPEIFKFLLGYIDTPETPIELEL